MLSKIEQSVKQIQSKINFKPQFGIILGTGLGKLVEEIEIHHSLDYKDIPNFPLSRVEFHSGKLIFGTLANKNVVVMQGRFHYYEGYSMQEITFPVRVMKFLGIEKLFVSNAAGGLNKAMKKSDIMIIEDHINLQPGSPARGKYEPKLGSMFPDMFEPYNKKMIAHALEIAKNKNIKAFTGVYVSVAGPHLETQAEYKYLRLIGADAVGMSTTPEVIVANQMGLPVFAISCITDEAFPEIPEKVTIESVLAAAAIAEPKMTAIMKDLIASL